MVGIRAMMNSVRKMAVLGEIDGLPADLAVMGIELMSQIERVYNYAHTGNTACLMNSVMSATWLSSSAVTDGLPSINPRHVNLLIHDSGPHVWMSFRGWPTDPLSGSALLASKAAVLYH